MSDALRLVCAAACLLPTACATPGGGALGIVATDPNQHVSGAEPLLGTRANECDPSYLMEVFAPEPTPVDPATGQYIRPNMDPKTVDICTRIRRAMGWALLTHPSSQPAHVRTYSKEARNEVIGLLMAESDAKCDKYSQFIEQYNSNVQSGLGIIAHAASTIASVATGGVARGFSAGSSVATNASGQLAKGHFQDQTIPIIVQAYQGARDTIRGQVDASERKEVADYSLGDGIRDALRYHGKCSVTAGITETQQAVNDKTKKPGTTDEPGSGTADATATTTTGATTTTTTTGSPATGATTTTTTTHPTTAGPGGSASTNTSQNRKTAKK